MTTKQAIVSSLKQGTYVLFDSKPCIVKSIQISKTGKHGHSKCRIEAIGIIDNQKVVKVMPGHDKVDIPIIEKKNAQVLSVIGTTVNVMDMETYETFDLELPEGMHVEEGSQVTYWVVMDRKVIREK